ncbi:RNA-directed DNA polymerase [Shewanella algae]|uniref:RNA-directed DNA polymerase n=1 Tax=Shewanella algae TaxID=38313 RepID=UPI001BEE2608|nr:RNA-directed DNA polymerase [Shewanella algae]BCV28935.1 hypothetical protein TUM3811_27950 [Shewanella algae]
MKKTKIHTITRALEFSSVSDQTRILVSSIIGNANLQFQCGLPRGVEFSSSIADLILQEFDSTLKNHDDVFYYCRYVDDILIITNGFEDPRAFIRLVKSKLPNELNLNYNKQVVVDVQKRKKKAHAEVACFEYLGYMYTVIDSATRYNQAVFREIKVTLSKSKIKRSKRAFQEHCTVTLKTETLIC